MYDRMAVDVVDASHDAHLQLVFGGYSDVAQDRASRRPRGTPELWHFGLISLQFGPFAPTFRATATMTRIASH